MIIFKKLKIKKALASGKKAIRDKKKARIKILWVANFKFVNMWKCVECNVQKAEESESTSFVKRLFESTTKEVHPTDHSMLSKYNVRFQLFTRNSLSNSLYLAEKLNVKKP